MKFEKGSIVEHKLTHEKMIILGSTSAAIFNGQITSTIYTCRLCSRMDLLFNFDEIELKEIGVERQ